MLALHYKHGPPTLWIPLFQNFSLLVALSYRHAIELFIGPSHYHTDSLLSYSLGHIADPIKQQPVASSLLFVAMSTCLYRQRDRHGCLYVVRSFSAAKLFSYRHNFTITGVETWGHRVARACSIMWYYATCTLNGIQVFAVIMSFYVM